MKFADGTDIILRNGVISAWKVQSERFSFPGLIHDKRREDYPSGCEIYPPMRISELSNHE